MKERLQKIEKIVDGLLNKEIDIATWMISFLGVITLRLFVDDFIAKTGGFNLFLPNSLHNYLFFLINLLSLVFLFSFFLKIKPFRITNLFFWFIFGFMLPPILDLLEKGGSVFNSGYLISSISDLWLQYATFFGNLPSGTIYFGTRITLGVFVLACFGLIYVKSRRWGRALSGTFLAYTGLFFMASFPSWLTFGYYFLTGHKKISEVAAVNVVQTTFSLTSIFGLDKGNNPSSYLVYNLNLLYFLIALALLALLFFYGAKQKFLAVIKNARFPQIIYHSGLLFVGMLLGYQAYPQNLSLNFFSAVAVIVLLISVWLAWLTSVIVNDIFDFEIDRVSNTERPLQKNIFSLREYEELAMVMFALSLFGGLVVDLKFATLLLVYQFIAWIYSANPFRLKKFVGVATFLSAIASLVILFMGFTLFSGEYNLQGLPWRVVLLLIVALTISLPIKDFKDIEGDRKDSVWTVPVIFGEERGRLIVAVSVFISFMLSVFLLNEFRLFWWALLFGGLAFWFVVSKKPRQLFWWVLGVVFVYGIILVRILFL